MKKKLCSNKTMAAILEINNLSKRYGRIQAVNNLSLLVETGNIYGILGPNGSGKTTTLGIILGVINPNKGNFSWFGERAGSRSRKRIGAILETPNFYTYLSAVKNLQIVAEIKETGFDRIDDVLKMVNLYERRNDPMSNYSLGMKQRLALASALLADPEVLVLDEPTNGLDPQGIADVREVIQKTARQGKTIILASHILDEVEKICTHVAVIKKGNLLASGNIQNVLAKEDKIELAADDLNKLESVLDGYQGIKHISREGSKVVISVSGSVNSTALNKYLYENGIILSHLSVSRKSLESTFLELTAE
jgi:ABC-2 type transport system ATP-binding protein